MEAGSKEKTIGNGLTMRKWKLAILAAVVYGCTVFGGPQVYGMGSNKPKNPVGNQGVCGEGCLSKKKDQEEAPPTGAARTPALPALPDSATTQDVAREALEAIEYFWRRIQEEVETINASLQMLQTCPGTLSPLAFIESLQAVHAPIDQAGVVSAELMTWEVQECQTAPCFPYTWIADKFELNYHRYFPGVPLPRTPPTPEDLPLSELAPIVAATINHGLADFEEEYFSIEGFFHILPAMLTPEYMVTPADLVESIRVLENLVLALEAMTGTIAGLITEHCPELAPAIAGEDCTKFCENEILSFCSETKRETTDADTDGTVTPNLETDCLFCGPRGVAIGCASQIKRSGCKFFIFKCTLNYGLGGSGELGGD